MSYSVDIYDKNGKVVSKIVLDEKKFSDGIVNESLIHEYYLLQTSNARHNIACVKGRGEVAGSGRKLYKQKGTGNARSGGKDSPVRRGGGVAFGPRGEVNYEKSMPKKAKKLAMAGIITLRAKENALIGVKDFSMDIPKTKEIKGIFEKIGVANEKLLVVLPKKEEGIMKSLNNLPKVQCITVDYLNPVDVLGAKKILFWESALEKVNTTENK